MIKGLQPRLREIGKIKIGMLGDEIISKNGKKFRPPQKTDHFLITKAQKQHGENFPLMVGIMDTIAKETGQDANHLTRIPIMLMFNDIETNFRTYRACYSGVKCICKCDDGETASRRNQNNQFDEIPCDYQTCSYNLETDKYKPHCKCHGILTCFLPHANTVGCSFVYRTTGIYAIQSILSSLAILSRFTLNKYAGINLELVLSPQKVEVDRSAKTIFVANVIYPGDILKLQQQVMSNIKFLSDVDQKSRQLLLPTNVENEDDNEQEAIAEEFYPGVIEAEVVKTPEKAQPKKEDKKSISKEKVFNPPLPDDDFGQSFIEGEDEEAEIEEQDETQVLSMPQPANTHKNLSQSAPPVQPATPKTQAKTQPQSQTQRPASTAKSQPAPKSKPVLSGNLF